jgi:hypothetical protein
MGVTMAGATTDGLAGSWLEGAGTQGLSLRISWLLQPPIKLRAPIAIVEITVAPKTFMRLFFTSKSPVCYVGKKYSVIYYPDRMINQGMIHICSDR